MTLQEELNQQVLEENRKYILELEKSVKALEDTISKRETELQDNHIAFREINKLIKEEMGEL